MALYSDVKMFHFPEKLRSLLRDVAITAPVHIRIKPTNTCNHRCRYCAYLDPALQLGKDMRVYDSIPREKMLEICADIVHMGVRAVTYSGGGEPLLYPHLLEASKILQAGGVKLACLTNGSLLQNALAEFFAQHGTWIRVSMDGWNDESYTRYRGVKHGEFTKIMRNLENFSRIGAPCVLGVSYIVDANNYEYLQTMLARLKDVGVHSVKVSVCIVSNDPTVNKKYHQPHFEQVKTSIARAQADLASDCFEIHDGFHDLEERFTKKYTWCPYMQIQSIIGADSQVYTCHDKAYNLDTGLVGSLTEQSLQEFWMQNKQAFFKVNPSRDCNHHCVANAKNILLHDFLAVDPQHGDFV